MIWTNHDDGTQSGGEIMDNKPDISHKDPGSGLPKKRRLGTGGSGRNASQNPTPAKTPDVQTAHDKRRSAERKQRQSTRPHESKQDSSGHEVWQSNNSVIRRAGLRPPRRRYPTVAVLGYQRGPKGRTPSVRPRSNSRFMELAQAVAAITALLGLGLYGAIRFGHQVFCDELNIRPEEIGLTYAASVSRAAVIILAFVTSVTVYWVGGLAFFSLLETFNSSRLMKIFLYLLGAAVATLLGIGAFNLAGLTGGGLVFLIAVGGFFCGLIFLLYALAVLEYVYNLLRRYAINPLVNRARNLGWLSSKPRAARKKRRRSPPPQANRQSRSIPLALFTACVLVFAAFFAAGISARNAAQGVQLGKWINPREGFGILGLHAEPVLVLGDPADDLRLSTRSMLYLGQGDGLVVLYDVWGSRPIRLPSDNVSLITGTQYESSEITLSKNHGLDFDSSIEESYKLEEDVKDYELHFQGSVVSIGSSDPDDSEIKGYKLDPSVIVDRASCKDAKRTVKQLKFPTDLTQGTKFCIQTNDGLWSAVRIARVDAKKETVDLEITLWDY